MGFTNMTDDLDPTKTLSKQTHHVIAVVYGLLATSGFVLNTPVLLTFLKDRTLNTPSNRLVLSIAIADWLHVVLAYPLGVVANISLDWRLGEGGCTWFAFTTAFLGFGTMLHHATFAIERAVTIAFSMHASTVKKNIHWVILGLWTFALLWSECPLLGWSAYVPEGASTLCSIRWHSTNTRDVIFVICIFLFFFAIPILAMISAYSSIYRVLTNMTERARTTWGESAVPTLESVQAETKTARMGFVMSFCFLVAWTPYAVVSLYAVIGLPDRISPLVTSLPALFSKTSTIYNPIIYFYTFKAFRNSLRKTFKTLRAREKKQDTRGVKMPLSARSTLVRTKAACDFSDCKTPPHRQVITQWV